MAQPFIVHHDLNLRYAAGVQATRMRTIPARALVTPTGPRQGDWWQISACSGGQCSTGWVSSLGCAAAKKRQARRMNTNLPPVVPRRCGFRLSCGLSHSAVQPPQP
jgi:hypothetical protein